MHFLATPAGKRPNFVVCFDLSSAFFVTARAGSGQFVRIPAPCRNDGAHDMQKAQISRRTAIRLSALAALLLTLTVPPAGDGSAVAQTPALAIKGYDPVAYF